MSEMSATTIELTTPSVVGERHERCRVCLECMENTILLYTTTCIHEEMLSYLDILHLISTVKVENYDHIPQSICTACAERAESFYEFKLLCERSDKILESEFSVFTANKIVEGNDVKMEPSENDLNNTSTNSSTSPLLSTIDAENENSVQFNIDSMIDLEYDRSSSEEDNNSSTNDCFNGNGTSLNNSAFTSDYSDSTNSLIANNISIKQKNEMNSVDKTPKKPTDRFLYCDKCGEKFVRKVNLLKHTKKCAKSVPRKCAQCDYKPSSPRDYTSHLETHQKKCELDKPSDFPAKTYEKCAHCGFKIVNQTVYIRHLKQFHADEKMECGVCKKEFYDARMLGAHARQEHPEEKKFPDECHLCGFTPNSYTSFVKHMEELHAGFSMKRCKHCDHKTISLKRLKQHIKLKHDEKRIKCLRCDKKYLNRKDMVLHLRRIHGEEEEEEASSAKKYKCKLCYKRFVNQSSLLVHEVSHSKESNYQCEECGSSFKQLKILNEHMLRVHRLERKHKCVECSKKFFYKAQLEEHKSTHAEARGFPCTTCGKKFRSKHNLQVHQVVHTGEKPHPCKLCGKRFTQTTGLKKHMTHHHGKS